MTEASSYCREVAGHGSSRLLGLGCFSLSMMGQDLGRKTNKLS